MITIQALILKTLVLKYWALNECNIYHYSDLIMGVMAPQITSLTIVYSTVYSGADQRTSKLRASGLCKGNSPVTGEFPAKKGQ